MPWVQATYAVGGNPEPDWYLGRPVRGAEVTDVYAFELFVIEGPIFANIRINILIFILKFIMPTYYVDRGCPTV
jgi:hypothetical protein